MHVVETADRASDTEALVESIVAALSGPDQAYVERVPGNDPDTDARVKLIRACGRRAGRRLGVRVQTVAANADGVIRLGGMLLATDHADGSREVHVLVC